MFIPHFSLSFIFLFANTTMLNCMDIVPHDRIKKGRSHDDSLRNTQKKKNSGEKKREGWAKSRSKPRSQSTLTVGQVFSDHEIPDIKIFTTDITYNKSDKIKKGQSHDSGIDKKEKKKTSWQATSTDNLPTDTVQKRKSGLFGRSKSNSHDRIKRIPSSNSQSPLPIIPETTRNTPLDSSEDKQSPLPSMSETSTSIAIDSSESKPSLLQAVRDKNYTLITELLQKKDFDPNEEIEKESGNTAFLLAAQLKDKEALLLFLSSPYVDTIVRNKSGDMGQALMRGEEDKDSLSQEIFARQSLEIGIKKFTDNALLRKSYREKRVLNKEVLNNLIQMIIIKAGQDAHQQTADREMPSMAAKLPNYVTNEFISCMVYALLDRGITGIHVAQFTSFTS
jgi:hypothetical protein